MRNKIFLSVLLMVFVITGAPAFAQDAASFFREGLNAYFIGSLEEAAGYFSQAIALNSSIYTYHYYLGRTYERLQRPTRAIDEYKSALRLKPDYLAARLALANLLYARNATDLAIEQYQLILEQEPTYFAAHFHLGVLYYSTGNHTAAAASLLKALEIEPEDPEPHYYLGRNYIQQMRWLDAINRLSEAIRLSPGVAKYYYWRGNAHYAREDYNSDKEGYWLSVHDYSSAIELGFSSPQGYFMFGNTLLNRAIYYHNHHREQEGIETLKTALVQYKKVISIDPNASNAFNNLGLAYFALMRYDESIEAYERAISLEPTVAFFHDNLGDALYMQGQFAKAIDQWRLVLELEPDYERFGLVLFMPGASIHKKVREAQMRM